MSQNRRFNQRVQAPDFVIPRGEIVRSNGLVVKKIATAVFDTAGNDSAGVSNKTIAAHGSGVYLPDNAVITKMWWDVITTFTSAGDTATIAIHALGAGDLLAAVAIETSGDVLNAGLHHGLPGSPILGAEASHDTSIELAALMAASYIKLTAEKEIIFTVAVQALTAGKLVAFVEYTVSD